MHALVVLAGLIALALPASAGATVAVSPASLTFPERDAGSTSDPQEVTVAVSCTAIVPVPTPSCAIPDAFLPNPVLSGKNPADFQVQNQSCGTGIVNNGLIPGVCALVIRFKPQGPTAGAREAVLNVGTSSTNPGSVVPVQLKGSVTPAPPAAPAKKCKKKGKKRAAAAKGCKKKKKK